MRFGMKGFLLVPRGLGNYCWDLRENYVIHASCGASPFACPQRAHRCAPSRSESKQSDEFYSGDGLKPCSADLQSSTPKTLEPNILEIPKQVRNRNISGSKI